jgi:tripartite-type tricarboxylate transporter receptor subunit TctC
MPGSKPKRILLASPHAIVALVAHNALAREEDLIRRNTLPAVVTLVMMLCASPFAAQADPVADFYKGKTITLIVGTSPGNDYDFRGRLLARHLGRHIPGHPTIVVQNMPGAGGIKAANYITHIAPHDGTVVHMIMTNMMASQALGTHGVEFDTRKFRWIGNTTSTPNVINSWYTSGITKIEQVKTKPLIVGAPKGTAGVVYPTLLN